MMILPSRLVSLIRLVTYKFLGYIPFLTKLETFVHQTTHIDYF